MIYIPTIWCNDWFQLILEMYLIILSSFYLFLVPLSSSKTHFKLIFNGYALVLGPIYKLLYLLIFFKKLSVLIFILLQILVNFNF